MLPQLKQKTGIVKSKVPPPVPPRGSPKDRRGGGSHHQQQHNLGSSNNRIKIGPGATDTSVTDEKNAGSQIVNTSSLYFRPLSLVGPESVDDDEQIDYYTPDGVEIVPKFGERRSPSCVDDWLELNHLHNVKTTSNTTAQIHIKTKCLQREISFPAVKPLMTVPTIIQSFSSPSIPPISKDIAKSRSFTNKPNCLELEDLRQASSVSKLLATTFKNNTHKISTPRKQTKTLIKASNKRRAPCPDTIVQRCT